MPITITPDKTVQINLSEAGPDDALHIRTQADSFFAVASGESGDKHRQLLLLPGTENESMHESAMKAARYYLRTLGVGNQPLLRKWYADHDTLPLLDAVVRELLLTARITAPGVSPMWAINVGTSLGLIFRSDSFNTPHARIPDDFSRWSAATTITRIEPVNRFSALVMHAFTE